MTPLPTIDAAQVKTARGIEQGDPSKADGALLSDAESSFAAIFAVGVDAGDEMALVAISEPADISAEDAPIPELSTPELAIGVASTANTERNAPAALDASRMVRRSEDEQILPNKSLAVAISEDAKGGPMVKDPAKPQLPSFAQRMVEVQMPTKSASSGPSAVGMSTSPDGEEAASMPVDAVRTKAQDLRLATDGKISDMPLPKPDTPVMKQAVVSNAPTLSKFAGQPERMMDDPTDLRMVRDEMQTDGRLPAKATAVAVQAHTIAVQSPLIALSANDLLKLSTAMTGAEGEVTQTLLGGERPSAASSPQAIVASPTYGAETARHVAQQLVANVTQHPGKVTEIALNPEELGRVRLAMTSVDAAITLNILAERPETIDLLRRHIDVLAQEFRDLGYDNINFSFGADSQADRENEQSAPSAQVDVVETMEPGMQPAMSPVSGLDLRL